MRAEMGSNPRALLDQISTDHPIILADYQPASDLVQFAGSGQGRHNRDSRVPEGGVMERAMRRGPKWYSGWKGATASVRALITRTEAEMADAVRYFVKYFNSMGFTAFKEPMAYETELATYFAADKRGDLTCAGPYCALSPLVSRLFPMR